MGARTDEGSGHGRQRVKAGTQPAEQATAGGHSQRTLRPAQASQQTDGPQLAGLAAKTAAADDIVLPLAVQLGGGEMQSCWQPERRVQTYLLSLPPTNAFACHCPYPLP